MENKIVINQEMYFHDLVEQVDALLDNNNETVLILDFSGINYLTSPIMGAIASISNVAHSVGKKLYLINFTSDFLYQLDEMNLMTYMKDTEIEFRKVSRVALC